MPETKPFAGDSELNTVYILPKDCEIRWEVQILAMNLHGEKGCGHTEDAAMLSRASDVEEWFS